MTEPVTPFDDLLAQAREEVAGVLATIRVASEIVADGGEVVDPVFAERVSGGLVRARARLTALEICRERWLEDAQS